jgi:hypothetical protein
MKTQCNIQKHNLCHVAHCIKSETVLKQKNNKRTKHKLILVKADKGKTFVIIDEDKYERKNR